MKRMRWIGFFRRADRSQPAHLATGEWGERVAERRLKGEGYRILGRRVRVGRRDELDLVARDGGVLVFVEVKTRRSEAMGRPVTAVTAAKRRALSRAAMAYLRRLRRRPRVIRFDVVEVVGCPEMKGVPIVRHLKAAFPLSAPYRMKG